MIKSLNRLGIEEMYLNVIKAVFNKPTAKHCTKWGKTKTISSKARSKISRFTLSTLFQYSIVCKHSNKKRERNKRDTNWKGRSQFIHI
jgi:hypothetical protein